jgi:hypothetical protein
MPEGDNEIHSRVGDHSDDSHLLWFGRVIGVTHVLAERIGVREKALGESLI